VAAAHLLSASTARSCMISAAVQTVCWMKYQFIWLSNGPALQFKLYLCKHRKFVAMQFMLYSGII
jgi:hypothetical protein